MKKIIIALIFTLINFNICFASLTSSDIQLSKIERSIWGLDYSKEDVSKRLTRIEKNVFGTTNTKLSNDERLKKISETMGYENYEDSVKQAYELDSQQEAADVSYPQIDALEFQLFSTTYLKENIYKRLERLEKKIFGSVQEGSLASRTHRLKAYVKKDEIASQNPNQYVQKPYQPTRDIQSYTGSQQRYDASDIHIQIAGLESALFSKTYSQDPVGLRLNRLERKIFQRDFSSDDEYLRVQRLQAAANAQQTARLYEANKLQKYTSTGIQVGSIILMILALIL